MIELADQSALVGRLATRDRLTGAFNRHGVEERIPDLLALAARHQQPVFAVFADVDGLKAVNDTHGHAVGDAVLVATADAIRSALRATDLVGRWGGDEFVVLGMGQVEHADALRGRITSSILSDGVDPALWDGGISVGIASAASCRDGHRGSHQGRRRGHVRPSSGAEGLRGRGLMRPPRQRVRNALIA